MCRVDKYTDIVSTNTFQALHYNTVPTLPLIDKRNVAELF